MNVTTTAPASNVKTTTVYWMHFCGSTSHTSSRSEALENAQKIIESNRAAVAMADKIGAVPLGRHLVVDVVEAVYACETHDGVTRHRWLSSEVVFSETV